MHILPRTLRTQQQQQQQRSRGNCRSLKSLRLPIASRLRFNYFAFQQTKRLATHSTGLNLFDCDTKIRFALRIGDN